MHTTHIILGAAGHVGSSLAQALLARGEAVTVVLHDAKKAADWQRQGAQTAVVDVLDTKALHHLFRQGKRLFLLNPPAAPATDTATEERRTLASILTAIEGSGLQRIVAESTYGAQPGEQLGDLGVLYEMEQALGSQPIPASIIRAAYYMSNWDAALPQARQAGQILSFYPPDFQLPMVAPHDIGLLAARLMTEPTAPTGLHSLEGPTAYTPADVATAFAAALHQPVQAVEITRTQWPQALQAMGFSEKAAESFINMTAATLAAHQWPESPERGTITLSDYIATLVRQHPTSPGYDLQPDPTAG